LGQAFLRLAFAGTVLAKTAFSGGSLPSVFGGTLMCGPPKTSSYRPRASLESRAGRFAET
jgi:hypothetical protein